MHRSITLYRSSPSEERERDYLILSLKRALQGEVFHQLRSAQIRCDEQFIYVYFYYDGEVSEDDQDSMSSIVAESSTDFIYHQFSIEYIRLNYPSPIPIRGDVVYLRKELEYPGWKRITKNDIDYPKPYNPHLSEDIQKRITIVISFIHCLLGEVSSNLQAVTVKWDANSICGYFYFDDIDWEIHERVAHKVMEDMKKKFNEYECTARVLHVDDPSPEGGESVYGKKIPAKNNEL